MALKREEIDPKYKWDLSDLYSDEKKWEIDYNDVLKNLEKLKKYEGKLFLDAKTLLSYLKLDEQTIRKIENIYCYAARKSDEDTSNNKYQKLSGKANNLYNEYLKATAFATPELLKHDFKKVLSFIEEEKGLKYYEFNLEKIYRYQKYTLSKKEERLLSVLNKALSGSEEIFSMFNNTDIKFKNIKDETNKDVELTHGTYTSYLRSKNRKVRQEAFLKMHQKYASYINTLASNYATLVETNNALATIRGFNSALESSLYHDALTINFYENFIKSIEKNLDIVYDYYKMKKEYLKLDELHNYDLYVDLVQDYDKDYLYDEAKKIIIEALSIYGKDYIDKLKEGLENGWIDVYENASKRSGAYSSGTYDSKPYILLNYQNKFNDVSTLAHELGHSMHTLYSKTQKYIYSSYPIFLAEIASNVNELLLMEYILKNSNDRNEKLAILNEFLEQFRTSVFRQCMFSEFEKKAHEKAMQNEVLTSEVLNNMYFDLNKKYMGESVTLDEQIKYEWARIPHFYSSFYVYKYATGLVIASYISSKISSKDEAFTKKYIQFLSSGEKNYPLELLKECGIDFEKEDIITMALNVFKEKMALFKKLYRKEVD